ncbi:MAG: excinuclease ABC subunit C [Treponema sp. CETP13]|nr:MAG: excinuclease ABC subunit C [Treponema sp. CETP13]
MNTNTSTYQKLHDTAIKAPTSSGVYLWKDKENTILYVGKAKHLKNRLSSYFSGQKDIKTRTLISKAYSIEYITTANEYEAFNLENTLIKQHRPKYNIALKDDKSYAVLRITKEKFPRIFRTRRIIHDGSNYYGPFPNGTALFLFIEALNSIYPLVRCKNMHKRTTPCMYYHIGKCSAPCCNKISEEDYASFIGEIRSFLEDNPEKGTKKLALKMKEAAKELKFEKAARLRDGMNALKELRMQNAVVDFNPESRDYIGYYRSGMLTSFAIIKMRSGKMVMRDLYRTKTIRSDDELLSEFVCAYYTSKELIPPRIFVQNTTEHTFCEKWLEQEFGIKTHIMKVSSRLKGYVHHEASQKMAIFNAKEDVLRRIRERGDIPAMKELQKVLHLDSLPVHIEGFDIAHIGGRFPIASLVSFKNGNPDKKQYRYFRLKTTDGIVDDFASMKEATARRYTRLLNEQAEMPDLIVIDGGIGQVNAVQEVLDSLELNIPIAGLAKQDEEIYLPRNSTPIHLERRSDALRLMQRVRDETHRFATTRNQRLRTKENVVSVFEQLPHVGKKRTAILIDTYISLNKLLLATPQEIADVLTIPISHADDILAAAQIVKKERNKTIFERKTGTLKNKNNKSDKVPSAKSVSATSTTKSYTAQLAELASKEDIIDVAEKNNKQ